MLIKLGLYFVFVLLFRWCILHRCYWWLGDVRSCIPVLASFGNNSLLFISRVSSLVVLGSWSQCSPSKAQGLISDRAVSCGLPDLSKHPRHESSCFRNMVGWARLWHSEARQTSSWSCNTLAINFLIMWEAGNGPQTWTCPPMEHLDRPCAPWATRCQGSGLGCTVWQVSLGLEPGYFPPLISVPGTLPELDRCTWSIS